MDDVGCSYSDNMIQNCEHEDENEENCDGNEGAGVQCYDGYRGPVIKGEGKGKGKGDKGKVDKGEGKGKGEALNA